MINDDYEELPCPDTNTFKVGDLVRVYDGAHKFQFAIKDVDGEMIFAASEITGNFPRIKYSFKQCRPLKKKEPPKPREFWIYKHPDSYGLIARELWSGNGVIHKVQDRCHKCGEDFNK